MGGKLLTLDLDTRLIFASFVTPYRIEGRGAKNGANDAAAICEGVCDARMGEGGACPSFTSSNGHALLPSKLPSDGLATHDGSNMLPQALLNRGLPRHQSEAHCVVEHGETTTCKLDGTAVDAAGAPAIS